MTKIDQVSDISSMFPKILLLLCVVCCATSVFAFDAAKLETAKQKFEQASGSEAARQEYVSILAAILGSETAKYIDSGKRDQAAGQAIDKLDAELKAHPAPEGADSKVLSKLRVGKWQGTRHNNIYRADGTWQMDPDEGGTTTGRWYIKGNRYFDDDTGYKIICLNDHDFVFTDGGDVFYERHLSE